MLSDKWRPCFGLNVLINKQCLSDYEESRSHHSWQNRIGYFVDWQFKTPLWTKVWSFRETLSPLHGTKMDWQIVFAEWQLCKIHTALPNVYANCFRFIIVFNCSTCKLFSIYYRFQLFNMQIVFDLLSFSTVQHKLILPIFARICVRYWYWSNLLISQVPVKQPRTHYDDVIMGTIASQITCLTSVYSTVYSGADQSKHQSSASLAFVWGIHRGPVNSSHKWPVTRKMFPFDDVIMDMNTCITCIN